MTHYILRDRKPVQVDVMEWAKMFDLASEDRVIGYETIAPGIEVSTVFLGLDHQFGDGPPLLFETMIFGGPLDC